MRKIWLNGKILPETEAKISVYDSACMFGDTCFEMTRSFKGVQFKLQEHIDRLFMSAKYLRISIPYTKPEVELACQYIMEVNKDEFASDDEHRLMINVTRGILGIYQNVEGVTPGINVMITDFPLRWTTAGMGKLFDTGVNCAIPSQRTIPASLLEPKVKNRNRIHYLMGNIEVSRLRGENNWALFLDPDGYIAEGAGCNFFIVKDKKLFTPEGRNVLRGISRKWILDNAYDAKEANIEPYDVYDADEAFVTGTPFCMLPVVSINGIKIGNGKPGPVFDAILGEWSKDVAIDIKAQIQDWDKGGVEGTTPYSFK